MVQPHHGITAGGDWQSQELELLRPWQKSIIRTKTSGNLMSLCLFLTHYSLSSTADLHFYHQCFTRYHLMFQNIHPFRISPSYHKISKLLPLVESDSQFTFRVVKITFGMYFLKLPSVTMIENSQNHYFIRFYVCIWNISALCSVFTYIVVEGAGGVRFTFKLSCRVL